MPTYHSNARTNLHVRKQIQDNPERQSQRQLAARFRVSVATINKWSRREDLHDASCRPRRVRIAFTQPEEQFILHLRTQAALSLDELHDQVKAVLPLATRASLSRLLRRQGLGRRLRIQDKEADGAFDEEIVPGFLHIDSFILTCLAGQSNRQSQRQHCFVAIDRATRMVFLAVYDSCASEAACHFLERCRQYFPFALHTILTDNGGQYTLKANAPAQYKAGRKRPFERLCARFGITHKTTRPYHPQTNGLVERANGLIQEGLAQGGRYRSPAHRDQALVAWLVHYTFNRRHRRIPLGPMTPYEAACRWHATHSELFTKRPDRDNLLTLICSQPPET